MAEKKLIRTPEFGEALAAAHPSPETISLMAQRRSTAADFLGAPGPDTEQLSAILTIAARAPDHRRVTPYRFVIFTGDSRKKAGTALAETFRNGNPDCEQARIDIEQNRFLRAPVVIAIVYAPDKNHRTPEWEQTLSVGAVCQNLLIASSAFGFAAQWLTEWYAYDKAFAQFVGLGADEQFAGFVYVGSATQAPKERRRPDMVEIVTYFES